MSFDNNIYFLNKKAIFLICICILSCSIAKDLDQVSQRKTVKYIMDTMISKYDSPSTIFNIWHLLHKKEYSIDSKEGQIRHQNFITNYHKVKNHNGSVGKSYSLGLNTFADHTLEEFHAKYLKGNAELFANLDKFDYQDQKTKRNLMNLDYQSFDSYKDQSEMKTVNWINQSHLTQVEDQGKCGSCWAFSTIQAVQAAYGIKTGKSVILSKQQLVDCETGSNGCHGGLLHTALKYIQDNGINKEVDYKYQGKKGTCQSSVKSNLHKDNLKISGYETCWAKENKACANDFDLHKALSNGPVAAVVDAGDDFMLYEGGIYDKQCDFYNHAILVIGYSQKTHEGEENYWIVKNSWGNHWGEHGYIKIKQSEKYNSCLLNQYYARPYFK